LLENGSIHSIDLLAQAGEFRTRIGSFGVSIRLFGFAHSPPAATTDRRTSVTIKKRVGAGVGVRKAAGDKNPANPLKNLGQGSLGPQSAQFSELGFSSELQGVIGIFSALAPHITASCL